ncbi:type I restriction endonuclease subunit S [Staphylococcus xylosus]|nr:type I restriction endonuclease subunit S [Staphylococcus xylosus]
MTNEVKNIPELRFPEFSGEWEENILGEVVIIKSGWSPSNFEKKDASVLLIKVDDLNYSSRMINNSKLKVNENNKYKKIKKDSIIFPKRGAAILTNKVRILGIDSYMDSNMMALEPKKINSEFLFTFIGKTGLYKIADTSTIPQINNKHIEPYNILLPSSTEQKYIGDFFSKLDRQIELEEQKLEKLKEQKKGYMQKIFSQEIRFKDDNGNDYPEWESKKFLDIFKLAPSKNNQIKSSEVVENGIIPVVDQGKDIFLGYSNEKDKAIEDFDNVIVYGDHTTIIKYIKEPFIIGGDGVKLLESNDGSLIHYLYILLQYFNVKPEGYKRHYSILKNKMMNISNTKEEQEKIGDFFNELDELIEKQSSKIVVLKQRKKGFLQKMFV